jgi:hypothetical protein
LHAAVESLGPSGLEHRTRVDEGRGRGDPERVQSRRDPDPSEQDRQSVRCICGAGQKSGGVCGTGLGAGAGDTAPEGDRLIGTRFVGTRLVGTRVVDAVFVGAVVAGAVFAGAVFVSAVLAGAVFASAVFVGAVLAGAVFVGTVFLAPDPGAGTDGDAAPGAFRRAVFPGVFAVAVRGDRGGGDGTREVDRGALGRPVPDDPGPTGAAAGRTTLVEIREDVVRAPS